jgi:response regulator RpfG family c-di-GMP phosphodiesterase
LPRKSTILLVDDSLEDLELLKEALSPAYHVLTADNGVQALALAAEAVPELVLLDVKMPAMDGYEVCRRLKAEPKLRSVPVIFLTGMDREDSEAAGLVLGAVDFISKASPTGLLHLRVRNHLNQKLLMDREERLAKELRMALAGRKGEEATRAGLTAGVVQELDNLLTEILGKAALAQKASTPRGEAAECIRGIEQTALRARDRVRQRQAQTGA